ncbi:hypothetical protein CYMTET_25132 [Cymbomonas tetramitiformis]|uniref:Uncharacterized protein n=1 Tax=Cymbomonas tetramitiformis TaxID=36881 RepID=A0AAE0FUD9_9CHLO|nr:hypothetical protein CYMTET_25132 [Cymbomonas tetramitiformis]
MLRLADSDRPSASKMQYHKFEVQETLKALKTPEPEPWAAGEYDWDDMLQEIIAIHRYRWDYGYTIVQGTGYLLDPEFVDVDQHLDAETMESLTRFFAKTYPKPKPFEPGSTPTELEKQAYEEGCRAAVANRSAAEIQLLEYKMKRGVFSRETVWETAKHVSAADFWFLYGSGVKELQLVAMRACAQVAGAGSAERGHKMMNFIEDRNRNRLLWEDVESRMYVCWNSLQLEKLEHVERKAGELPICFKEFED